MDIRSDRWRPWPGHCRPRRVIQRSGSPIRVLSAWPSGYTALCQANWIGLTFSVYCTVVLALDRANLCTRAMWIAFSADYASGADKRRLLSSDHLCRLPWNRGDSPGVADLLPGSGIAGPALTALAAPVAVPGRLLPIVGNGLGPVVRAGFLAASYAGESTGSPGHCQAPKRQARRLQGDGYRGCSGDGHHGSRHRVWSDDARGARDIAGYVSGARDCQDGVIWAVS